MKTYKVHPQNAGVILISIIHKGEDHDVFFEADKIRIEVDDAGEMWVIPLEDTSCRYLSNHRPSDFIREGWITEVSDS